MSDLKKQRKIIMALGVLPSGTTAKNIAEKTELKIKEVNRILKALLKDKRVRARRENGRSIWKPVIDEKSILIH